VVDLWVVAVLGPVPPLRGRTGLFGGPATSVLLGARGGEGLVEFGGPVGALPPSLLVTMVGGGGDGDLLIAGVGVVGLREDR
jgi:hypothetical protein